MRFTYDCPKCGEELTGGFGEDVYCEKCDTTYETDWDYIGEDSMAAWITSEIDNKKDMETIYKSLKTGNLHELLDGKINIHATVQRDLSRYNLVGTNNMFDVYESKRYFEVLYEGNEFPITIEANNQDEAWDKAVKLGKVIDLREV